MIKKVTNAKIINFSTATIRKATKKVMKKQKKDAISDIAQRYVVRKKLNPEEPLPIGEAINAIRKIDESFWLTKF